MQTTLTYDYSPELVKRVARQFIWHHLKRYYIFVGIIGLYGIITLLMGDQGLFQGASITLLGVHFFHWVNYWRGASKIALEMTDRSITVQFSDEGVIFQTIDHISIVKWQRIKQILKLQEAWLFFMYTDYGYTMVPTQFLTEELKVFIEHKAVEHGGQIKEFLLL